jgi:hypothetical protein
MVRAILLPIAAIIGHFKCTKARKLEAKGQYKEACFKYAVAILNGGIINDNAIKHKIKYLWVTHGPFNYEQDLLNDIAIHGETTEQCNAAGHALVMSIINESII